MIHLKFSGYAWFIQSYSHDILHGLTALKGGVIISPFPVRWENVAFLFHKRFIYLLFLPSLKCLPSLWFLSRESEWDLECKKDPHHKEHKLQYHLTAAWKTCKSDFYNSSEDLPRKTDCLVYSKDKQIVHVVTDLIQLHTPERTKNSIWSLSALHSVLVLGRDYRTEQATEDGIAKKTGKTRQQHLLPWHNTKPAITKKTPRVLGSFALSGW